MIICRWLQKMQQALTLHRFTQEQVLKHGKILLSIISFFVIMLILNFSGRTVITVTVYQIKT
jgi:hypothetical protein